MTPTAINIAIAKTRGWTEIAYSCNAQCPDWHGVPPAGITRGINGVNPLPDYCGDLNAIHEVVITLRGLNRFSYRQTLGRICGGGVDEAVFATAAQCCEAYLITLGRWEETPQPAPVKWKASS